MLPAVTPDVRITVDLGAGPVDVTLSYPLSSHHDELLHKLREHGNAKGLIECRMHDDQYSLKHLRGEDGRVHGAWLMLKRHPGDPNRLQLAHWPLLGITGSHTIPSAMTPEHRAGQEYIARRGEEAGLDVELECSLTPGTRSDVVVKGVHTLAAEVQVSGINVATVLRRSKRVTDVGAVSTWFTAQETNPPWAFKVPTVMTNRPDHMRPGGWTVTTGPRKLEWEKCGPGSRIGRCPTVKSRNWCGKWHPLWTPMHRVIVDDVVRQVPAGELVRVDTGTRQGSILTTAADSQAWADFIGPPKVPAQWDPNPKRGGMNHADYAPSKLRARIEKETVRSRRQQVPTPAPPPSEWTAREPALHRPRNCDGCGRLSTAIVAGQCLACRNET